MPAEVLLEVSSAAPSCPKHMEYGPCGGVEFDGTCEVATHACVFLGTPTVVWHGVARPLVELVETRPGVSTGSTGDSCGSRAVRELLATRPIVVADFPAAALSAESIAK